MSRSAMPVQQLPLRKRGNSTPYIFLLPAIVTICAVVILPLVLAIIITFNNVNLVKDGGKFNFAGLANYASLVRDPRMYNSLLVSVLYVTGAVVTETVLSILIALFLNRKFRGKSLIRTLILIPMFVTPVVVALTWRMFYDPTSGIINFLLGSVGLGNRHDWLGSTALALPSVLVADVWEWTPSMVLIIMAGLDSVPQEMYEAAYVDGSRELQTIRYITIPLLIPAIGVAVILRAMDAVKAFDLVYVMTKGGPGLATETTNMYAYTIGFQYFKIGYATTVGFVFTMLVTILASFIVNRTFNRRMAA